MTILWKVICVAIAISILGVVFFKSEMMPDDYAVITDEKSFTIEELIENQEKSDSFSYEIPVFKEVQANNIVSISIVNYTNEQLRHIKKISMTQGRFFSKEDDMQDHCIISEATSKIYFKGSNSAIDKNINIGGRDCKIIGVYKGEPNNKNAMYLYLSENSRIPDVSGIKSIYLKLEKTSSYDEQINKFLNLFNRKQDEVTVFKK